jgi:hypothetical protein
MIRPVALAFCSGMDGVAAFPSAAPLCRKKSSIIASLSLIPYRFGLMTA